MAIITPTTNNTQTAIDSLLSPFYSRLQQPIVDIGWKTFNVVPKQQQFALVKNGINDDVYEGKIGDQKYFTIYTASVAGDSNSKARFYAIKNLLKRDYKTEAWKINNTTEIGTISVLSFDNTVYGSMLFPSKTDQLFQIEIGNVGYTASNKKSYDGGDYDLKYQYTAKENGFAQLLNSNGNIKGYMFGQLGMILLASEETTYTNFNAKVKGNNIIGKQHVTSQTHFCRITNDKYNASNNPSWYKKDQETGVNVIKHYGQDGKSFTAITTIGLYSDDNQLLAIAKLSKPVLKYTDSELHVKVVVQY